VPAKPLHALHLKITPFQLATTAAVGNACGSEAALATPPALFEQALGPLGSAATTFGHPFPT